MTLVDLPVPGTQVGFDLSRRALQLYPAIGGAQFGLGLDIYRMTERKDAPPLTLAAAPLGAWKGPDTERGGRAQEFAFRST